MLSNKISRQIEKIPHFNRSGSQSITIVEDARRLVAMIPVRHRRDPETTYQDAACGTGLDALVLAEQLMNDLQCAIPDERQRLSHIFQNQIFLSDIDPIQARIARANVMNAVDDMSFEPNVQVQDCFQNRRRTTYTFGSIDFDTTNEFVEHYLNLSEHVIVITKSNSHRYVESKLSEISSYQFLRRVKMTPMCLIHVPKKKSNKKVTFITGKEKIVIENPVTVPTEDSSSMAFVHEVLSHRFEGYSSESGPENNSKLNVHPGNIPLIFKKWREEVESGKKIKSSDRILMISKISITPKMGYGVEKLIVPKNGNPGRIPYFYWDDGSLACSAQTPWIAMTKIEFDKLTRAINNEPCYNVLFKAVLIKTHTKDFWSKIPKIRYLPEMKKIYDRYYL